MFTTYVKQLFLFIFVGLLVTSCDSDNDSVDCPSGSYDCAGVCDGTAVLEENGECHDHGDEHCDEIDDEMECNDSDHCEWHADENACEDHDDHDDSNEHTDADGLVLEDSAGNVWYSEFEGAVVNNLQSLEVGDVLDLSVHFLDHDGEEIEHVHSDEEDGLNIVITDGAIVSVVVEEHSEDGDHDDHGDEAHCEDLGETECGASDHCEWHVDYNACEDGDHDDHADEDHDELAIELTAISAGSTTFQIQLMHGDHADYTTLEIAVTVSLPTAMSCNSVCFKNCCSSQLYASK